MLKIIEIIGELIQKLRMSGVGKCEIDYINGAETSAFQRGRSKNACDA